MALAAVDDRLFRPEPLARQRRGAPHAATLATVGPLTGGDSYRDVRFVLIPGTREMYVSLNDRRARALVVLQSFQAFVARGR